MPHRPSVALVMATPATVLADYRRLLDLADPALALASAALVVVPAPAGALPGERAEPWQVHGTLRALGARVGAPPAVLRLGADSLDPLAAVARRAGAPHAAAPDVPRIVLCGAAQAAPQATAAREAPQPALYVVDAVTVLSGTRASPRLDVVGALLASKDIAALAALLARESARGEVELLGDAAAVAWLLRPGPRRPNWYDAVADRLAAAAGLALPAAQQAYEEWLAHTGWGRLYRAYQRRALDGER